MSNIELQKEIAVLQTTIQGMSEQLAEANKMQAEHEKTAKSRYIDLCVDDEVTDPIERLRVFCSLSMNHNSEDWLYCERFFDEISALLAKAKEEGRAEAQAQLLVEHNNFQHCLNELGNERVALAEAQDRSKVLEDVLLYVDDCYCFTNDERVNEALSTTSPTEALDKVVRKAVEKCALEALRHSLRDDDMGAIIAEAIRRIEP